MKNFKSEKIKMVFCKKEIPILNNVKFEVNYDEENKRIFFIIPNDATKYIDLLSRQCKKMSLNIEEVETCMRHDMYVKFSDKKNTGSCTEITYEIIEYTNYNKVRVALQKTCKGTLNQYLSDDDLLKIYRFKDEDPLKIMLSAVTNNHFGYSFNSTDKDENKKAVRLNLIIEQVLKLGNETHKKWLREKFDMYLKEKPLYGRNAILGEIFTMGYIFFIHPEDFTPIKEGKVKTPDFETIINNHKVYIEVNTPSMNEQELKKLENFQKKFAERTKNAPKGSVQSAIITVSPVGYNPKFKTVGEMCISKFSNIKSSSGQLSAGNYNILAINLFNKDYFSISNEAANPLFLSFRGESFYSGYLWQAFYAQEGDIVLEDYLGTGNIPTLEFNGMFEREENKQISAAIIMIPYKTIIYENHNSDKMFPYGTLLSLTKMPYFDLNLSQTRIPIGFYDLNTFKNEIEYHRKKINSISKVDFYNYL